ncbi:hypothetical protein [Brevibacillus sp. 179-C9.3 HS]|uniref:hypothetical protein n=1 Tax=unclassified Brevibacillus TaxID=2684853 RepID=UPI0039A0F40F
METERIVLYGGIYGLCLSVVLSLISSIGTAPILLSGGNLLNVFLWMFLTSFIPFTVIYALLAKKLSNISGKRLWLLAAITAFIIVLLAGSLGAVIVESYQSGYEKVNILGFVYAAPVYSLILLPITCPIIVLTFTIWKSIKESYKLK